MSYVVLTIVPRLHRRPKPGESLATGIREEGCNLCYITYRGKLDSCWKHMDEHTLWAEKWEIEDEPMVVDKEPEIPILHDPTGVQEPVEVS